MKFTKIKTGVAIGLIALSACKTTVKPTPIPSAAVTPPVFQDIGAGDLDEECQYQVMYALVKWEVEHGYTHPCPVSLTKSDNNEELVWYDPKGLAKFQIWLDSAKIASAYKRAYQMWLDIDKKSPHSPEDCLAMAPPAATPEPTCNMIIPTP